MSNAKPAQSAPSSPPAPPSSAEARASRPSAPSPGPLSDLVEHDPYCRPSAPPLDFCAPRESGTRAAQQSDAAGLAAEDAEPIDDCPPTVRTPRLRAGALDHLAEAPAEPPPEPAVAIAEAEADDDPDWLRVAGAEADFFRFESFPPVVEDLDEPVSEPTGPPPPTAEQLARTAKLQKGVGAVVALAAVLAVVAVIVGAFGSRDDAPIASAQGARRAPIGPARTVADDSPRSADRERSGRSATKRAATAAADPATLSASPSEHDTTELRAQAVAALAAQRLDAAEQLSRQLIANAPDHAFGYRCLGAVLQDRGEWSQAHEIYGTCVREAVRGDVGECRALGGRK